MAMLISSPAMSREQDHAVLNVPPNGEVSVFINGRHARFQMHGNGSSAPMLDAKSAAWLGLKAGFISIQVLIGSSALNGETAVISYAINGRKNKRRAVWFQANVAPGYAGVIGPGAVPFPIVRFDLHPAAANEREFTMPLSVNGRQGMATRLGDVYIQFDPLLSMSYSSAGAGAVISALNNGHFEGAAAELEIRFGVRRPVRRVKLASPLKMGPVALSQFDVRTADYGSASSIPDQSNDPDEIVVIAKHGIKSDPSNNWLHIGRDAFGHCSSITFDTIRKLIRFSCPS